jgi:hypothetical protein
MLPERNQQPMIVSSVVCVGVRGTHVGYEPPDLLHKWIFPTINQTKNLHVFYDTVVKKAYTAKGMIQSSTSHSPVIWWMGLLTFSFAFLSLNLKC